MHKLTHEIAAVVAKEYSKKTYNHMPYGVSYNIAFAVLDAIADNKELTSIFKHATINPEINKLEEFDD